MSHVGSFPKGLQKFNSYDAYSHVVVQNAPIQMTESTILSGGDRIAWMQEWL